jgi:hypothetical protein
MVREGAGGSDYLPILTSFQSLNVPNNLPIPIFELWRHILWSVYADAMLDLLVTAARGEVDVEKRYETFIGMIRSSAEAAQTRTHGRHQTAPSLKAVWWDAECDRLSDAKLIAFRHFWSDGNPHNYNEYKIAEINLNYSCTTKKKIESWRRYCANMTYETQLADIWKMAKRLRGFRSPTMTGRNPDYWFPGFASWMAPDFVPNQYHVPDGGGSTKFGWLADV